MLSNHELSIILSSCFKNEIIRTLHLLLSKGKIMPEQFNLFIDMYGKKNSSNYHVSC